MQFNHYTSSEFRFDTTDSGLIQHFFTMGTPHYTET